VRAKLTKEMITLDSTVVGMGIRMRASGYMTYVVQYRLGTGRHSKSVRVTLDDAASVNLDEARKVAGAILGSVALGNDSRQERKAEAITLDRQVSTVINEYDRDFEMRMVSPHHRSNTISILRKGLAKYLASDLAELVLRDFVRAKQNVTARHIFVTSNHPQCRCLATTRGPEQAAIAGRWNEQVNAINSGRFLKPLCNFDQLNSRLPRH
jgi:hypothetical protein